MYPHYVYDPYSKPVPCKVEYYNNPAPSAVPHPHVAHGPVVPPPDVPMVSKM